MKKFFKLIFISLCLCVFCVAPNAAFAVEPYEDVDGDICATTGINDPLLCGNKTTNEENSIMNTVGNVLNAIYGLNILLPRATQVKCSLQRTRLCILLSVW